MCRLQTQGCFQNANEQKGPRSPGKVTTRHGRKAQTRASPAHWSPHQTAFRRSSLKFARTLCKQHSLQRMDKDCSSIRFQPENGNYSVSNCFPLSQKDSVTWIHGTEAHQVSLKQGNTLLN